MEQGCNWFNGFTLKDCILFSKMAFHKYSTPPQNFNAMNIFATFIHFVWPYLLLFTWLSHIPVIMWYFLFLYINGHMCNKFVLHCLLAHGSTWGNVWGTGIVWLVCMGKLFLFSFSILYMDFMNLTLRWILIFSWRCQGLPVKIRRVSLLSPLISDRPSHTSC